MSRSMPSRYKWTVETSETYFALYHRSTSFRSKQLITILNRLGHSESYDFGLELKTAMAEAIEKNNTYLTPDIAIGDFNLVFHSAA